MCNNRVKLRLSNKRLNLDQFYVSQANTTALFFFFFFVFFFFFFVFFFFFFLFFFCVCVWGGGGGGGGRGVPNALKYIPKGKEEKRMQHGMTNKNVKR